MANDNATLVNLLHSLSIAEGNIDELGKRKEFDRLRALFRELKAETKELSQERWFN
jgi:hypothetical protein